MRSPVVPLVPRNPISFMQKDRPLFAARSVNKTRRETKEEEVEEVGRRRDLYRARNERERERVCFLRAFSRRG